MATDASSTILGNRASSPPDTRSYADLVAALYAQNQFAIKYDLDAMREAVGALGLPAPARKVALIAGTNGKGTTAAALNAIALAAGWRVGLYTSPHLVDFRERIRLNAHPITEDECARVGWEAYDRFSGRDAPPQAERALSYFELATIIAWQVFAESALDLAIFEVGLGGRLDATNVVEPDVSVVTSVALDHQAWLGESLEEIAREKTAVGRPGRPLVIHEDAGGFELIHEAARPLGVSIVVVSGGLGPIGWSSAIAAESFRLLAGGQAPDAHFERTASLGLARMRWPGRRQTVRARGLHLLVDGAHNPAAMATSVPWLRHELKRAGTLVAPVVLGLSRGRDPVSLVAQLAPLASRFIVTEPAGAPGVPIAAIVEAARETGVSVSTTSTPGAALELLEPDEPSVVTGSLYVIGEILAELGFTPESLAVYDETRSPKRSASSM